MTSQTYPYATGDLLDQPNRYSYIQFGSGDFLKAWRDQRAGVFDGLPEARSAPSGKISDGINPGSSVETAPLLDHIYAKVETNALSDPEVGYWLDALVKKFEVTKHIHRAYDGFFKAADKTDYKNLTLYVRLSEVFELAYSKSSDLRFLNVLLKSIDTLCNQASCLDEDCRSRLGSLIVREKIHVRNLCGKVAVPCS